MYPKSQIIKLFFEEIIVVLQDLIIRAAAGFRWSPGDVVLRTFDVTGLTVNAIGEVELQF